MSGITGNLRKMHVELSTPVAYAIALGDECLSLNEALGTGIRLEFEGEIHCTACGRKTAKSFNQGYCFPCSQRLAQCDICIVRPEKCHYAEGTCREPAWGDAHCNQPHHVYLANSSGLKVGITRETQVPTRWIDQGASQALSVFRVRSRYQSGRLEVLLKRHVADRSDWRRMLKGEPEPVDLPARRDSLLAECRDELALLRQELGAGAMTDFEGGTPVSLQYPVLAYPSKVRSLSFDKTPRIEGVLQGIKGQYLILDGGVLNIRKFAGYRVTVEV